MKYNEIILEIKPMKRDFADILSAWIAELGFESFVNTEKGLNAYIQRSVFDESALKSCLLSYPVPDVDITYHVTEMPDENWNQTWEEEGFKPITVGNEIVVHDSRYQVPEGTKYDILINPRLAFGTGSHETTRMILRTLSEMDLEGQSVVDAGTGTGILSIMALMRGAADVFAYDIDEWSVENTTENLKANNMEGRVRVRHGDAKLLEDVSNVDLLLANINRNILLNDLPLFRKTLTKGGKILLSGFLKEDTDCLVEAAGKLDLHKVKECEEAGWAMLLLEADAAGRMDV
ncbi:MAG: 50S ribosomal protein L11 methyltransferase [Bacteroidaceae bacterium]|nr:50S ribosomal protein L11 methyltransferase [Bacteroidaceae bacterium]